MSGDLGADTIMERVEPLLDANLDCEDLDFLDSILMKLTVQAPVSDDELSKLREIEKEVAG